jgi:AraC-like DNA-binding protein
MEDENRLIVFVASGDEEKARESIERAEETGPKAGIPAVMNRYLAFDILSAMAKGAQQAGVSSRKIVRYDAVEQARGQEIRETVLSMLSELCTAVREKSRENPPSSRLYEEVCRYIQENYGNPDLNISQTGLHFNLTPSYLSSLFKKESGVSLLGYINSIRIAKAKELLIRGDSVVNIAEQTGFRGQRRADPGIQKRNRDHAGAVQGDARKTGGVGMKGKRGAALTLAALAASGFFAGCSVPGQTGNAAGSQTAGNGAQDEEGSGTIPGGPTVTYWCELNDNVSALYQNLGGYSVCAGD